MGWRFLTERETAPTACYDPPPVFLLLSLALACAADQIEEEDCFAEEPVARIGGGAVDFEELAAGDTIDMVTGSQGGEHIYGSLRLWNTDEIVVIHYTIARDDDGSLISDQTYRVAMVEDEACGHVYAGMYGYLGFTSDYTVALQGVQVTLRIDATDSEGRAASDEVAVLIGTDG